MGTVRSVVQVTHMARPFVLLTIELLGPIHATLESLDMLILWSAFLYAQILPFIHQILTKHLFCNWERRNPWGKYKQNGPDT